jgi:hypothetical protein
MPRQKTGEKLGRPFIYTSDEERPVTVSLRIPHDLAARMKQYAYIHRQKVTELLLDGLKWRLEAEDPRWPSQSGTQHYGNTAMREEASDRHTATPVPLPGMDLTPVMVDAEGLDAMPREPDNGSAMRVHRTAKRTTLARLDADDLEDMPLVPETASAALVRQPASEQASPTPLAEQTPVDAEDTPLMVAPAFDPHKSMLGSPCKAGHRSHGAAGNLREIVSAACVACATEKKAAKAKAKRQGQPA